MRIDVSLLTEREVAEILSISIQTLRLWRRAGRIPFVKVEQTIRYHPCDVADFIASNRTPAETLPQ